MKVSVNGISRDYRTVWMSGSSVFMINQPKIPHEFEIVELKDYRETARAISTMVVRGAGAIGASAGFALSQAAVLAPEKGFYDHVKEAENVINATRPTAYDLFYATKRVSSAIMVSDGIAEARKNAMLEAGKIADENASACKMIGMHGEKLMKDGMRVLTHCNAGWLAFVDWGSALSPIYAAKRNGKNVFVFADETRPRCQGAALTAWELGQEGIDHAVIADNASGHYMKRGEVDIVIVGADRIALNGDVANKIGTYEKAVVAHENGVPFYVAAPTSTIDLGCKSGEGIPIEERSENEVLNVVGWSDEMRKVTSVRIAPKGSHARNPAFDVTPAKYIAGIITEKGIVKATKGDISGLF